MCDSGTTTADPADSRERDDVNDPPASAIPVASAPATPTRVEADPVSAIPVSSPPADLVNVDD